MSTRSCIVLQKSGKFGKDICLYHHWDGYPNGVGALLVTMLKSKDTTNLFSYNEYVANNLIKNTQQQLFDDDGFELTSDIHNDSDYLYIISCGEKPTIKCYGWKDFCGSKLSNYRTILKDKKILFECSRDTPFVSFEDFKNNILSEEIESIMFRSHSENEKYFGRLRPKDYVDLYKKSKYTGNCINAKLGRYDTFLRDKNISQEEVDKIKQIYSSLPKEKYLCELKDGNIDVVDIKQIYDYLTTNLKDSANLFADVFTSIAQSHERFLDDII